MRVEVKWDLPRRFALDTMRTLLKIAKKTTERNETCLNGAMPKGFSKVSFRFEYLLRCWPGVLPHAFFRERGAIGQCEFLCPLLGSNDLRMMLRQPSSSG